MDFDKLLNVRFSANIPVTRPGLVRLKNHSFGFGKRHHQPMPISINIFSSGFSVWFGKATVQRKMMLCRCYEWSCSLKEVNDEWFSVSDRYFLDMMTTLIFSQRFFKIKKKKNSIFPFLSLFSHSLKTWTLKIFFFKLIDAKCILRNGLLNYYNDINSNGNI